MDCQAIVDVERDVDRRTARLKPGVEDPGGAKPVEPRALRDEGRLMNMTRDHHRRLMALDPLHKFDVAKEALAAPARRGIRRRRVMRPNPSRRPSGGVLCKLRVNARLDQRSVPPWADRKQRVANRQAVAVAGNAEFSDVTDPARDLLAVPRARRSRA